MGAMNQVGIGDRGEAEKAKLYAIEASIHGIGMGCSGINASLGSCSTKILEAIETISRRSTAGGVREAY